MALADLLVTIGLVSTTTKQDKAKRINISFGLYWRAILVCWVMYIIQFCKSSTLSLTTVYAWNNINEIASRRQTAKYLGAAQFRKKIATTEWLQWKH